MSYLVLARRLRPQTFEQVIGQEHVTRTLKNALITGRMAHAFLFSGTRGVGKTSAARILAKAINCLGPVEDAPCNQCASCQEINQGGSVDVMEIDGASNNSVDQIRDLRENAQYLPASSRRKVYIIDEVHMLSKGAFNALLKTLEEPPEHVVFIFATTEVHKVPATILSRCQRYNFRPIPPGQVNEYLLQIAGNENLNLSPEAAAALARAARGSMRDGLSLLDQTLSFSGESINLDSVRQVLGLIEPQLISDIAQAVLNSDGARVLSCVSDIAAGGYDLRSLYQELLTHFRNLVVLKVDPEAGGQTLGLSPAEVETLSQQTQSATAETLQLCLQGLIDSERMLKAATQPRIAVELALLKLCHMIPVVGLDDILVKLDSLRNGLGGAEPESRAQARPEPPLDAPRPRPPSPALVEDEEPSDQDEEPFEPDEESLEADEEALEADEADQAIEPGYDLKDPMADWSRFVSGARGLKPSLKAMLAKVKPIGLEGNTLLIKNGSSFDFLSDPDRREELEKAVAEFFGRRFKLKLVLGSGKKTRKEDDHKADSAKQAALNDPRVKEAVDLFDASLLEIKPAK